MEPRAFDGCRAAFGVSLGEYCALPFAGAYSFEDGAKLMKLRYDKYIIITNQDFDTL